MAAGMAALGLAGSRQMLERLALERTTLAGREMIRHATLGAYPEPLLQFLEGVFGQAGYEEALQALCRMGAQSGCDLLAGAVGVLLAWIENAPGGTT